MNIEDWFEGLTALAVLLLLMACFATLSLAADTGGAVSPAPYMKATP